jgi:hypothetical protein
MLIQLEATRGGSVFVDASPGIVLVILPFPDEPNRAELIIADAEGTRVDVAMPPWQVADLIRESRRVFDTRKDG